jgi:hypothetical protein
MADKQAVTLSAAGGDVTLDVIVTHQKPASISVGLFGSNRKKERDYGTALTLKPPDPDVFGIEQQGKIALLNGKLIGIFTAISSFTPAAEESVSVISTLRQGGIPLPNGTIHAERVVKNGGAGAILVYELTVS